MKILCPIDLSEAAINAIEYAARLAKASAGCVSLLHTVPETVLITDEGHTSDTLLQAEGAIAERLEAQALQVRERFRVPCNFTLSHESLSTAIGKRVQKEGFDLVLMGTEGASELRKFMFGSNTTQVMEKINSPVMVVPADFKYAEIKHLVYATNYQPGDDESIVELFRLADLLGANVTILHVGKHYTSSRLELFNAYQEFIFEEFYYDFNLKVEQVIYDDVAEGLLEYMDEKEGDVLAMLTHHRSFFQELFHESLTRKMALLAEYPLLVFHK